MDPMEVQVWSVSQVNSFVKETMEGAFNPFWVRGEISNLVIHRSGHVYFTLKDAGSQLRGCWFSAADPARRLGLANGSLVEAFGKLGVYAPRGEYQINVRQMRLAGVGDLVRQFEEIRRKLEAEGLFAPERKRPIPALPRRIGVVTSPTGAAIRDFLQIIDRRFPNVHVTIYPCQVQGGTAAAEAAAGVAFFNRTRAADVIVVTRGGGSMEDLWPFNSEILARQVAASSIPVISAIGHEIDFTICDFASDLRAPTPSAAAELVIGRRAEFADSIDRLAKDMRSCLTLKMRDEAYKLDRLANSYVFREPLRMIEERHQYLDDLENRMRFLAESAAEKALRDTEHLEGCLKALNPLRVLERGYAFVTDREGHVVSTSGLPDATPLKLHFADGSVPVKVDRS
ncbi:MAG: exodeoxyribonuclease VII large subunit [Lentisphaeria bacterium]|nr:exodeoxyribonuclease VII large subunit [Lentisphaeria bacterium]